MKKSYILAILSGVLLGFSFPPLAFLPFILIAFIPLFYAIEEKTLAETFKLSFVAFFIFTVMTMYWVLFIQVSFPQKIVIFLTFIFFSLVMTIPILMCRFIMLKFSSQKLLLTLPVFWGIFEFTQNYWEYGVSWTNIGYGLSSFPSLMQFYSFSGIVGGGVILILINVLIFLIWNNSKRKKIWLIALTILGFIGINMAIHFFVKEKHHNAKITIIQPNIDSYEELNEHSLYNQVQTVLELTKGLEKGDTDLIVCPESFLKSRKEAPIILNNINDNPAIKELKKLSLKIDAPIITGLTGIQIIDSTNIQSGQAPDESHIRLYNSALLIAHDIPVQIYVKQKLVPMMEKVPFSDIFPSLKKFKFGFNQSQLNYSNEWENNLFVYRKMRIAPAICYDAASNSNSSQLKKEDANLIVVMSNDWLAGKTSGFIQASYYARALAIQHRLPVIRSANTGRSSVINQSGEELSVIEWNTQKAVTTQISY